MDLLHAFDQYINDMAGLTVSARPQRWGGLPPFLRQRYDLHRARVAGSEVTIVVLRDPKEFSPATFEKHLRQLPPDVQKAYVVVAEALPAYVRQRLVQRRIPFVVPDVQLHWPDLGVAVRARRGRKLPVIDQQVGPATQAVIVGALVGAVSSDLAARDVARLFGYTQMTMTRVFNELEAAGLAETSRRGHERRLHFTLRERELWTAARPRLRNPVRRALRLRITDAVAGHALLAGESALAAMTMLAAPEHPVYAVGLKGWTAIRDAHPEEVPIEDAGTCRLQVWWYDPSAAARDGRVDPFSLLLSLQDTEDERVSSALEEMMEMIKW